MTCSRCGSEGRHAGKLTSPSYGMVVHTSDLQFISDKDQRKFFSPKDLSLNLFPG